MKIFKYVVVLLGVLIVLLEIFYGWPIGVRALQEPTPTVSLPIVGEPVTPGVSQGVQNLPTVTPRPPGVPAPEVNPRQRPNLESGGPADQSEATPTATPCHR